MNKDTIFYYSDADLSDSGGGAFRASRFMGLDQTGATGATVYYKNRDWEDGEENSAAITFSGNFRDLARAYAGACNSTKPYYVIADAVNSVYFSYPGGTVSGTPTVTLTA